MKETKKQIEANLRNKIAKQYTTHIDNLQERLNKAVDELYEARGEVNRLKQIISEKDEKIEQYEDWVHRLQEFMDMSEEDRKTFIEREKQKQKFSTYIENSVFFKYLSTLYNF